MSKRLTSEAEYEAVASTTNKLFAVLSSLVEETDETSRQSSTGRKLTGRLSELLISFETSCDVVHARMVKHKTMLKKKLAEVSDELIAQRVCGLNICCSRCSISVLLLLTSSSAARSHTSL